ncbi:MAG: helix-turn-helix transcriptional regulator [Acidimicrobiales bacterium]
MRNSAVVAEVRRRAGLTQQALAELASTTQSTIAAYEAGAKEPSAETMTRIARAAGFAVTWDLAPASSLLVRTVQTVGDLLWERAPKEGFRLIADLAARLDRLLPADFTNETRQDPGSTGDRRWDALVAGVVERAAHRADARAPSWTAAPGRFLDAWWFVSPYGTLHASALVESPPELANRGVFVHESSLARV